MGHEKTSRDSFGDAAAPRLDTTVRRSSSSLSSSLSSCSSPSSSLTEIAPPSPAHLHSTTNFQTASQPGDGHDDAPTDIEAIQTTDSSVQVPAVSIPRSERRGILGRVALLPEVDNPRNYSRKVKWTITLIVAIAAGAAPFGSVILLPSLTDIARDLQASQTLTNVSIGLYMISLAIFPLVWSSFCEEYGRRSIYLISFTLAVAFNVGSALSNNIAAFIILRMLSGGASASVQTVGGGTIADLWHVRERGKAMGAFYLGPLMGPLLAPLVGGGLQLRWGWRSTMWFLAIYSCLTLFMLLFALPETLPRRVEQKAQQAISSAAEKKLVAANRSSKRVGAKAEANDIQQDSPSGPLSGDGEDLTRVSSRRRRAQRRMARFCALLHRAFIEPFMVMGLLRYPAVALTVYYAAITFSVLYMLQVSIQATFSAAPYHFTALEVGLLYLANSTGYVIASLLGGRWTDHIMAREARRAKRYDAKGKLIYRPEDRMRENAWIAAIVYPGALIWYGWTAEKQLFWAIPIVANFFFGLASMMIFGMITTMLTEFMPRRASSGIAINNFVRSTLAAIGSIVTEPLLLAIGNGWLFTGLGVIALASSSVIAVMKICGPRWRQSMDANPLFSK